MGFPRPKTNCPRREVVCTLEISLRGREFFEDKVLVEVAAFLIGRGGSSDFRDFVTETWIYIEFRLKYLNFSFFGTGRAKKTSARERVLFAQYLYFCLNLQF